MITQSLEFPEGYNLCWIWNRLSEGGVEEYVRLYVLCLFMIDQNLANLKFIGYLPSHCHYFHPLVSDSHGPPSYLSLTGHIILLLKSFAIDSY